MSLLMFIILLGICFGANPKPLQQSLTQVQNDGPILKGRIQTQVGEQLSEAIVSTNINPNSIILFSAHFVDTPTPPLGKREVRTMMTKYSNALNENRWVLKFYVVDENLDITSDTEALIHFAVFKVDTYDGDNNWSNF